MIKIGYHIIISLLFLVSTTGLTVNLHYCQDSLYSFSFFTDAQSCCSDPSHHHNHCTKENNGNHCNDETIYVQAKGDYTVSTESFGFDSIDFISLFLRDYITIDFALNQREKDNLYPFVDIPPPNISGALSFLQTYLL